jgi:MFS family permease
MNHPEAAERQSGTWLNRNVVGMGLTSLLSDISHEMATAVLPGFLTALGVSAAALGLIEGVADGVASFVKLASGWLSDRAGRRKPIVVGGYFITGSSTALFALAAGWPLVLFARAMGWFGRGIRAPPRNRWARRLASSAPVIRWAPSSARSSPWPCWHTSIPTPPIPPQLFAPSFCSL